MDTWTPIELWAWSLAVAGLGGLAVLLKSTQPITLRSAASYFLFHGLTGSAIGFLGFHYDLLWKGKQGVAFVVAQAYGVGVFTLAHVRPLLLRAIGGLAHGTNDDGKP
jgi:hypothetical protein